MMAPVSIFSRLIAILAFLLLLPVMVLIGLLLFVEQGWPVLFRQERSGLHQRPFIMVKFRTMRDDFDGQGNLLPDELRVTRTGRFLRRSRLDELPELWNIMRGDMAFIGPRPLLVKTVADYGADGDRRAILPPGLTGWAQVNGNALLNGRQKLKLDLWYVENRHILLDMFILWRTVLTVIFGEKISRANLEKAVAGRTDRGS